jgi:dolichol-phosphate mannosyltransferase
MRDGLRGSPPAVSVIVPTLNEAGNIDFLLESIFASSPSAGLDLEVIVVDDGSTDGTRERVTAWEPGHAVRLVARDGERDLAGAVLAGARVAAGDVAVVMDADLSHPPDKIAELVRPILEGQSDLVIGSRRVPGGGNPGWSVLRRIASRVAAAPARLFVDVHDPLSGFFSIERKRLLQDGRHARGFKILLDILLRSPGLRVQEVPITFRDRSSGRSKVRLSVIGAYLRQLVDHARPARPD